MGIVWIKALTLKTGHANVIKHVDPVLERLAAGTLDPSPMITHHMKLDDAAEAYDVYDDARRSRSSSLREAVTEAEITWEQFEAVEMRVGRVTAVDDFPEARRRPGS